MVSKNAFFGVENVFRFQLCLKSLLEKMKSSIKHDRLFFILNWNGFRQYAPNHWTSEPCLKQPFGVGLRYKTTPLGWGLESRISLGAHPRPQVKVVVTLTWLKWSPCVTLPTYSSIITNNMSQIAHMERTGHYLTVKDNQVMLVDGSGGFREGSLF